MPRKPVPELARAQQQLINDLIPTARSRRLTWSGGETQVIEAGEGPPLLFIHGGLSQATEWLPLWPQLQAAILGEKSPQEALDEAADAAREIMEDAGYIQ